ncbi:hypothetical protein ScalyP_jg10107 [Parmales sp. scaly parma]|jgi:COP9 signalosome complex subunit 5|nr:hypothetical protein ScalyP_jg10107 [Parmales sp. scaly parma]|tara:strand:- start:960 stop:1991 length:1032 start_codon:yes stop_codon:yes gene_type:complete
MSYLVDTTTLATLRSDKPWINDPLHFKSTIISPSAIVKMLSHCQSGVEKGIRQGGKPIEVMGLVQGRPDTENPGRIIITDVFPLPIEGFETRVIADDQNVVNYMIALGDSLENSRVEKFCGWYHSHPFDVSAISNCFFSSTDLSTQLSWQRSEDPHGNPWVGFVIDPQRTVHQGSPEIKAFRAFPPEYERPIKDMVPDGTVITTEKSRLENWGSCWSRYYSLDVEYFMSDLAQSVIKSVTENLFWMKNFTENEQGANNKALFEAINENVGKVDTSGKGGNDPENNNASETKKDKRENPNSEHFNNALKPVDDNNSDQTKKNITEIIKQMMFGSLRCDCNEKHD